MKRTPDLISYLPHVLQVVREFQAISNVENPEFQVVFDTSEQVLNNLFIQTGYLNGIKRYEKILKIKPSENDTLETRRFRVLSRWNDRIPYTWNSLIEKLNTLCGQDNYTISLQNDIYTLNLETHLGVYGTVDELNILLDGIIPCNLIIIANNVLYGGSEIPLYFGSAISSGVHYTLSSDFNGQYSLDASLFNGAAVSEAAVYQLTSDMQTTLSTSGTVTNTSVPVVGSHIELS